MNRSSLTIFSEAEALEDRLFCRNTLLVNIPTIPSGKRKTGKAAEKRVGEEEPLEFQPRL
jgi:hypothetical protein